MSEYFKESPYTDVMQGKNAQAQCNPEYQKPFQGVPAGLSGAAMGECSTDAGNSKIGLGFTFSEALERLKNGQRMRRAGWNGIGQYVFLWHGVDDSARHERASHLNAIRSDLFGTPGPHERIVGRAIRMMPHFRIATGQSGPVATWVPSVTDLLAEDWHQV